MLTYLLLLSTVGQVAAANIRPQIGYVYPPAVSPGATVEVQLGTYDWTPDMQLLPHDARATIEITGPASEPILTPPPFWFGPKAGQAQPPLPREVPAKITLPADLPPGELKWQAANANGGSNVHTIIVSELNDVVEPEVRTGVMELPSLPAAASGRIARITEIDEYKFTAPATGQVVCRLDDRLGQPFFGALTIKDAAGNIVADGADTAGTGVTVRFVAQANATYTASIHDVEFGGDRGYVYRLVVRQSPDVLNTLPLVLKRGEKQAVQLIGWGLTKPGELSSITGEINPPAQTDAIFSTEINTPAGKAPIRVAVGNATDALEPTATDIAQRTVAIPAAISASFDRIEAESGMPVDRYRFAATKGQTLRIVAEVDRFGSPVDPTIIITDSSGKELVRNDDAPGASDALIEFKVAADGEYDLAVSDVSGFVPTLTSVYRLTIDDVTTLFDFELQVPDRLDIPLAGKADLALKANRLGVWKAPISLKLEGLPAGVEPAPVMAPAVQNEVPADKPAFNLTLNASDQAAATASLVRITATATLDGKTIEHHYGPVLVTTTLKTRVKVKSAVQDGGRIVNRGTTYPADVLVERLDGYEGPVILQMAATQQRQRRGIRGGTLTVPAGVDAVQYPVYMPEWLETSLTARMNVIGVTPIADPKGNIRHVTGIMDGFIVMSLEGALLKLTHEPLEYVAAPGGTVEIPVKLSRTVKLQVPAQLEVVPAGPKPIFTADAVNLPVDAHHHTVKLQIAADAPIGKHEVQIRATAQQDGKWPAVSETSVTIYVDELPK